MNKKLLTTIFILGCCTMCIADIGYLSYSDVFTLLYLYSILPVIVWLLNLFVTIQTLRGKMNSPVLFWTVNISSILLSMIMLYPVSIDISEMGMDAFEIYGLALIVFVMIPSILSLISIRKYLKK